MDIIILLSLFPSMDIFILLSLFHIICDFSCYGYHHPFYPCFQVWILSSCYSYMIFEVSYYGYYQRVILISYNKWLILLWKLSSLFTSEDIIILLSLFQVICEVCYYGYYYPVILFFSIICKVSNYGYYPCFQVWILSMCYSYFI